jgi:hypothetical protein
MRANSIIWEDPTDDRELPEIVAPVIARITRRFEEQERLERENDTADPEPAPEEGEKIGEQLRCWPQEVAAMPTELTRASLFVLVRRGRRKILDWEKLESRADIEVAYSGKQLDQADADLWLACLRLGRGVPLGQRIYTTRAALLQEIGKTDGSANHRWLIDSLDRMSRSTFRVIAKRNGKEVRVTTGMLKYGIEKPSGQMYIRLDPEGAALFENLAYVGWEQRLALTSNAAKALQLYVSGHMAGKPHAVLLADLARWMGYEGRLRQFRASLRPALAELAATGMIHSYGIKSGPRGDIAYWTRGGVSLPTT